MKSISKIMTIFVIGISASLVAGDASKKQESTILKNVAVGAAAGTTEVVVFGQSASYAMNQMIQGRNIIPKNPSRGVVANVAEAVQSSYRGCKANVAGMAPITAIQVAGTEQGNKVVKEWQNGAALSDTQKLCVAATAGAASGIVATPSESIPVNMQKPENKGKTTMQVAKGLGIRGIMRGCGPTTGRDGIFTAGYMSMNAICVEKAKKIVGDNYIAPVAGGIAAGVMTAIATQPLAVVKTNMQADPDKKHYHTAFSTVRSVWRANSIKGVYSGLLPRGARIMVAIPVLGAATTFYSGLITSQK